jgi:hypothetical protein
MGEDAGIEAGKLEVRSSSIQHPYTRFDPPANATDHAAELGCRTGQAANDYRWHAGWHGGQVRASTTTNVNFNLTIQALYL